MRCNQHKIHVNLTKSNKYLLNKYYCKIINTVFTQITISDIRSNLKISSKSINKENNVNKQVSRKFS